MRILFVIPTLCNGGAERAISNITTHLPQDIEADILINSVSENDYPTDAKIISLGMKPKLKKSLMYQVQAAIMRTIALKRLKKTGQYDACISFMDSANLCNIFSGNKYCRTIISIRTYLSKADDLFYKLIVNPLAKMFYKNADKIVAVSLGIQEDLTNNFFVKKDRVVTITNGYDIEQIRKKSKEEVNCYQCFGTFNYITVGSYTHPKGHWHLIRAFKKVVAKVGEQAHLIILGQGSLKEYLQEVIKRNHLEKNVTLMPYTDNPFAVMSKCDVYVMPSLYEGYSNALCEAYICGLPCIATDFKTSARDILAPDTDYRMEQTEEIEYAKYGILTPVCSGIRYQGDEPLEKAEELLADAMIKMHDSPDIKDKYTVRDNEYKKFDISEKVKEYMELI